MMRCILVAAVVAAFSVTSTDALRAQGAQGAPVGEDVSEMAELFHGACGVLFPQDDALEAYMASDRFKPMSPTEVDYYMHGDPAKGWVLSTAAASYVVLLEKPPVRACSVRRMTPNGPSSVMGFVREAKSTAAREGLTYVASDPFRMSAPGEPEVVNFPVMLARPGQRKPVEVFMFVATNYHGRYDGPLRQDVRDGIGVEVRFVRQLQ